jgi:hypothetical protein
MARTRPPLTQDLAVRLRSKTGQTLADWSQFETLADGLLAAGDKDRLLGMLRVLEPTGLPADPDQVATAIICSRLSRMPRCG